MAVANGLAERDKTDLPEKVGGGDPAFTRMRIALFASGFTVFGLLYYVQSLLPLLANDFEISPTSSSLALSSTTGVMAFALLFAGAFSDRFGRKQIMALSLLSSSILTAIMAFSPGWSTVLAIRFLMGISLSGVQSVTMAYLAEEVDKKAFAATLGLFIGGSAFGGMFGRMISSVIADYAGWRVAVGCMGTAGLIASVYFLFALPASRHFVARGKGLKALFSDMGSILRDTVQIRLLAVGFVLMSGFVTTYNFITFRLTSEPFDLSQTVVGMIFIVYLCGSVGAVAGGRLCAKFGHQRVLWSFQVCMIAGLLLTLPEHIALVILGLAVMTFGMFAGHSAASGWVSQRAEKSRALAASLYLFTYYQGGSIVGASGGLVYQSGGWSYVVALTVGLGLLGLGLGLSLWLTVRN